MKRYFSPQFSGTKDASPASCANDGRGESSRELDDSSQVISCSSSRSKSARISFTVRRGTVLMRGGEIVSAGGDGSSSGGGTGVDALVADVFSVDIVFCVFFGVDLGSFLTRLEGESSVVGCSHAGSLRLPLGVFCFSVVTTGGS